MGLSQILLFALGKKVKLASCWHEGAIFKSSYECHRKKIRAHKGYFIYPVQCRRTFCKYTAMEGMFLLLLSFLLCYCCY